MKHFKMFLSFITFSFDLWSDEELKEMNVKLKR